MFVAQDEVATVTVGGPIATPSGGTPPYTVDPDPNNDILLTGSGEQTVVFSYKVTDANQDTAECSISVAILAGNDLGIYDRSATNISYIVYMPTPARRH